MKDWKILLIGVLTGVLAIIGVAFWKTDRDYHRMYGPNPGKVEFTTSVGGKGFLIVRDLDKAQEEVDAQIKSDWAFIKAVKGIEIHPEGEYPTVTIVKKIPAE